MLRVIPLPRWGRLVVAVAVGLRFGGARGPAFAAAVGEPEGGAGAAPGGDLVHVAVVHAAVGDGVGDAGGVADVVQRVGVHHHHVGQLADLQRADVAVHAQGAGPGQGAGADD